MNDRPNRRQRKKRWRAVERHIKVTCGSPFVRRNDGKRKKKEEEAGTIVITVKRKKNRKQRERKDD